MLRSAAILAIAIAGCGTPPGANIEDLDTAGRNPACVRECTRTYSGCASDATRAFGRFNQDNAMPACKSAAKVCVSTCERR